MKRNLIVVLLFKAFVLAGVLRIYVVACDSLNEINEIVREGNKVTRVPQRKELEAPAAATDEPPLSKFFLLEAPQVLIKPERWPALTIAQNPDLLKKVRGDDNNLRRRITVASRTFTTASGPQRQGCPDEGAIVLGPGLSAVVTKSRK
jgi:hypothetical protein